MTFDEFQTVFQDYLVQCHKVPDTLSKTINDLFEGPVAKVTEQCIGSKLM